MAELTPEQQAALTRVLIRENQNILTAIGEVTSAWGHLEATLYHLFAILSKLCPPDGQIQEIDKYEIAGVIFYCPSNMETRINLVSALFSYNFEMCGTTQEDALIFELWGKLKGKINALKNTRNAIAHGTIATSSFGSDLTKQRPRLTPALGDVLRFYPQIKKGQHPGLGSAEMNGHREAVGRLNFKISNLSEAARLRLQVRIAPDPKKDQALRELLSQLTTPTTDQNNQSHTQPK